MKLFRGKNARFLAGLGFVLAAGVVGAKIAGAQQPETPIQIAPQAAESAPVPAPAAAPPAAVPAAQPAPASAEEKKPQDGKAAAAPPTEAELAIVQNAEALKALSPPAAAADGKKKGDVQAGAGEGPRVTDILAEPAVVRPLPEKYLVVKRDSAADDADARLTAARMALARGRVQAALAIFDELYKETPGDDRVAMGRAVALQRLGQTDEALSTYEEALARNPENIEALTNMLGLLKSGDPEAALERLQQLRSAHPANADIAAQLGTMYGTVGDYANALLYLDMADALKPGNPHVLYNRAVVYDRMGKSVRAAELYREIVRLFADGDLDQDFPIEAVRQRLGTIR